MTSLKTKENQNLVLRRLLPFSVEFMHNSFTSCSRCSQLFPKAGTSNRDLHHCAVFSP